MSEHYNNFNQPVGFSIENWQGSRPPRSIPMSGRYCRLEGLKFEIHAKSLYEAYSQEEGDKNWTYLPYGPFSCFEEFESWMREYCSGSDPLFYAIINRATNEPVGITSYLRISPSSGVIEVGHIHYSPLLKKTPMATEAMYLMMQMVFEELGYRRYEWKCDALNTGSRKAALRLGFTYEGTFRQATVYKGRNRDTAWFSITDREWPSLKKAFEKWLSAENFDDEGMQKKSLSELMSYYRNEYQSSRL